MRRLAAWVSACAWVGGAITLLSVSGCAKYPSGGAAATSGDLLITMTVAGTINPNFYYFVVFNTSNDSTGATGPDPVITAGGNGFVSGAATQFVEYHGSLPGDGYEIYSFVSGTNLQQYTAVGIPFQDTPVSSASNSIEFRIPLSDLATSTISVANISYIQINFLTYSLLAVNPSAITPVEFDALGNTTYGSGQLNDPITLSVAQGATYNNTLVNDLLGGVQITNGSGGYTPYNEPALNIVGWSVQVEN